MREAGEQDITEFFLSVFTIPKRVFLDLPSVATIMCDRKAVNRRFKSIMRILSECIHRPQRMILTEPFWTNKRFLLAAGQI